MRNKKGNEHLHSKFQKKYEICICCGNETDIEISTPVERRLGYISGCGQMCKECYEKSKDNNSYGYSTEQLVALRELCQRDDKK